MMWRRVVTLIHKNLSKLLK
ncbi:hypothetical protein Goklo_029017 [Gossypium klotzschianum]|uniref:Uncharacterized protein n=1 Tax=Gossypium klotzschianum TaxID=34286 RepID=A0A7J8W9Y2_9ROSI|nr:hypothetical protein [Gossypium klotzschianum]